MGIGQESFIDIVDMYLSVCFDECFCNCEVDVLGIGGDDDFLVLQIQFYGFVF